MEHQPEQIFGITPCEPEKNIQKQLTVKGKIKGEEIEINLEIIDKSIKIILIEGINTYNGTFSLKDLQEKDKFFKMFETIEEAYNEIISTFNENENNIKNEGNNLILNIEIKYNHKKNIVSFILEKKEIKREDLIKSLYLLTNKYIKENNGLKSDIQLLSNKMEIIDNKINSIESKIDILIIILIIKIKI